MQYSRVLWFVIAGKSHDVCGFSRAVHNSRDCPYEFLIPMANNSSVPPVRSRSIIWTGFFLGLGRCATCLTGLPGMRPRPAHHSRMFERTVRLLCFCVVAGLRSGCRAESLRRLWLAKVPGRAAQTCRRFFSCHQIPTASVKGCLLPRLLCGCNPLSSTLWAFRTSNSGPPCGRTFVP